MRSAVALALLLAGCQLVFPLESGSNVPPVTGAVTTRTAVNQQSLAIDIVIGAPEGASVIATVDGIDTAVELGDGGAFQFERTAADYRLSVSIGDELVEIQDDIDTLALRFDFAGRNDFVQLSHSLDVVLPIRTTGTKTAVLASTGQWTVSVVDPNQNMVDWMAAVPTGRLPFGLLDADKNDRLFYLEYTNSTFDPNIAAIARSSGELAKTMSAGDTLLDAMDPVATTTANRCVQIRATEEATASRFLTDVVPNAVPDATYGMPARSLHVIALASHETGAVGPIDLASSAPTDLDAVDQTTHFFDPFHGEEAVVVSVTDPRQIKLPEAVVPVFRDAGFSIAHLIDPGAACPGTDVSIADRIAFPRNLQLAGKPLDSEGQMVTIARPSDALLTWDVDQGEADLFDVIVFQVVMLGTATDVVQRRHYRTRRHQISISDDVLERGKTYIIEIATATGLTDIDTGDYGNFEFPVASAFVFSSVFEAQ